jgi:predicted DNA-binding transcriptional regulator AlpA
MTDHAPHGASDARAVAVETDDVRAIAEAVADVLAERGLVIYAGPNPSARILKVAEVARLLGRSPPWVYEHAAELGAIRMGMGPKARIGFDLATIEQWKRDHQTAPPKTRQPTRRLPRPTAPSSANLIPYEPMRHRA